MARLTLVMLLACAWPPITARAQENFEGLRLKVGDIVYVTDPSGGHLAGRVRSVSPASLFIDNREIKPLEGLTIERRGDPLWDGAVVGALAGFALGVFTAADECGNEWGFARCAFTGAAWGTLFGTLIDWRHAGRTVIYVGIAPQPPPRPVVSVAPPSRTVGVVWRF